MCIHRRTVTGVARPSMLLLAYHLLYVAYDHEYFINVYACIYKPMACLSPLLSTPIAGRLVTWGT